MGLGSGVEAGGVDKERGANGNHAQNSALTYLQSFRRFMLLKDVVHVASLA